MTVAYRFRISILFLLALGMQGLATEHLKTVPSSNYVLDSPIDRNVTITPTNCGVETGAIEIEITSGSGDYSVSFDGDLINLAGNTFSATLLAAGSYAVTLFDNLTGCEDSFLPTVSSDGIPPDPDIAPVTPSCTYEADLDGIIGGGTVEWTASGPGSVDFNDATIEDPHVTVGVGGEYTFYIEETQVGCSGLDSIAFAIGPPETVSGGNDTTVCGYDLPLQGSESGGTWSWTSPGDQITFSPNNTVYNPTATAPGAPGAPVYAVYTIFWSYTDLNSCTVSGDLEVDFREQPVAQSTDVLNYCQLFNNTLEAVPAPPGMFGLWSIPTGSFNFNPILANSTIQNNGTFGTYSAIWTLTNSPFCTDSDVTQLIYTAPEQANIQGFDIQVCGNSENVNAINENGTWSSPDPEVSFTSPNSNSTQVMGSTPGNYTIIWTVGTGDCETSDDRNIVFYQSPTVNITTTDNEVCSGGSISLEATAANGVSLEWTSNGDGTFSSLNTTSTIYSLGPLDGSNASVTLTLTNEGEGTCPDVSDEIIIDIIPPVTVSLPTSSTTICSTSTISINGNATNTASVAWTTSGDGVFSPNTTQTLIAYTPGPNDELNGTVDLTLTGQPQSPLCSSASAAVTVTLVAPPNAGANASLTLCETGSPYDLSDAIDIDADAGGEFSDLDGSGALVGSFFYPSDAGVGFFDVSYVVLGESPCSDDSSILNIEIIAGPNAGTDLDNSVCVDGASTDLNSILPSDAEVGGFWDAAPFVSGSTFNQNAAGIGEFTFYYIVNGSNGCVPDSCALTLSVTSGPDAGEDGNISACTSSTEIDLYSALNGSPDPGGTWNDLSGTGALSGGFFDASQSGSGMFTCEYVVALTGCPVNASLVTITVTEGPELAITSSPTSICTVDTIFLEAEASNVTSLFWTSSGTGLFESVDGLLNYYVPSIDDMADGTVDIELTGTGIASCDDAFDTVTIVLTQSPEANAGPDGSTCGQDYIFPAVASVGDGIWSGPPGIIYSSNPNAPFTVPAPGSYTLTWTENNQGCVDSDQVNIEFFSSPIITSVEEICVNTGIEFQVAVELEGGDPSSYEFSVNGTLVGSEFTTENYPTGSSYSIAVWDANQCDTFLLEDNFTCPVLTDPGSFDTTPLYYCEGDAIQPDYNGGQFLDANDVLIFILHDASPGPGTILDIATSPQFTFLPSMQQNVTYYVTAVAGDDIGGGTLDFDNPATVFSEAVPVTYYTTPEVAVLNNEVHFCVGDSALIQVMLSGTPDFQLNYSIDDVPTQVLLDENNDSFYVDQAGSLVFETITDMHCSATTNLSLTIIEHELPSAILLDNFTFCSATIDTVPVEFLGTAAWNYELFYEGSSIANLTSEASITGFLANNAGTYSIANLMDEYCETDSIYSTEVIVNTSPIADAGSDVVVCTGDSITIGVVAQSGTNYSWTNAVELVSPNESTTALILPPASASSLELTYYLTADLIGCTSTDSVQVVINPLPQDFGIIGATDVCLGDSISLEAFGGSEYEWEIAGNINNPLSPAVYVSPEVDHVFIVEIINSFGCSVMDSTLVSVRPIPILQTSPLITSPCIPADVLWAGEADQDLLSCEWSFPGATMNNQDCGLADISYDYPGQYSGSVSAISFYGCTSVTLTDTIEIFTADADFSFSPTIPTIDDTLISVFDLSTEAMTHYWTLDGDSAGIGPETTLSFGGLRPGYYEVCLIMTTNQNCVDTTCKKIELDNPVGVYVPNTFTPDGDGLNDEFKAVINGQDYLQFFELSVYDRRGHVQFSSNNPNESWDGINKRDNTIAQGLFEWVLEIGVFGEAYPRRYIGTITVLK